MLLRFPSRAGHRFQPGLLVQVLAAPHIQRQQRSSAGTHGVRLFACVMDDRSRRPLPPNGMRADRIRPVGETRHQCRCAERAKEVARLQRETLQCARQAPRVHRSIILTPRRRVPAYGCPPRGLVLGEVVQTKFSLTEGPIPRALLAFALPWREIRMGVADASSEPVPTA